MRYIVSAFIFTLFSVEVVKAQGFYNPNDPSIPNKLKQAADSVFEIRTAYFEDFDNQSDITVADISAMDRNAINVAISKMQLDKKDSQVIRAFVDNCKTPEQKANCPIPLKINSGSSFIAGSGNTLWTNAHVMERMLNAKAVTNDKTLSDVFRSKDTMPIFIFNKNGEMIFDGLKHPISFKATPLQTAITIQGNSFYGVDSDYLAIELPFSLGNPLPIANAINSDGIAVIGYPYCTGCTAPEGHDPLDFASRYPYPDAEDCQGKITGGSLLNTEVWGQLAQVNQYLVQNLNRGTFIGYTADSQYGMSGGPVVNANGEVVGIHAGGKTIRTTSGLSRYSRGVRPPEFNNYR
jgi:hypothetical protein